MMWDRQRCILNTDFIPNPPELVGLLGLRMATNHEKAVP